MKDDSTPVGLKASPPRAWVTYVFLALWLMVVHAALIHFLVPEVMEGTLIDTDSYSRLIRVAQLQESGRWFDSLIPRMNAPYGLELHWTRPLDIIILASSWLLSPMFGFQSALHWSGAFLSPILHIITCLGLVWAVGPLFGAERRPLVVIVILAQPIVTSFALAGRADHHMLLVLAYVFSLGWFFRSITRPGQRWPAVASGAMAGLGLWVSVEFLLPLITLYATLTLLWLFGFPRAAWKGFFFSAGLAAVVGIALVVEHPPAMLLLPEYDRISAPHMLLAILALGFWSALLALRGRVLLQDSLFARFSLLGVAVVVFVAAAALTYPGVFSNPLTVVDPEFWDLYVQHFAEFRPLFPRDLSGVGPAVTYLGSASLALPFGLWMLFPRHDSEVRAVWLPVSLGLLIFVPFALSQARFGVWAGVVMAVALTGILCRLNEKLDFFRSTFLRASARVPLNAIIMTGFMFLGAGFMKLWGDDPDPSERFGNESCAVEVLAEALVEGAYGDAPRTLLAGGNIGPELVYRTPHLVIAAPYHRNQEGILDTYRIMTSTDGSFSRGMMETRGVDLVILCPDDDRGFFEQIFSNDKTLFRRLLGGRPPAWLRSVDLPGARESGFLVFEVIDN